MAMKFEVDLAELSTESGGEVDELFGDLEVGAVAAAAPDTTDQAWSTRFVAEGQKNKTGPAASWSGRFTAEGTKPAPPARASAWSARFSAEGGKTAPPTRPSAWSARFSAEAVKVAPPSRESARCTAEGTETNARTAR